MSGGGGGGACAHELMSNAVGWGSIDRNAIIDVDDLERDEREARAWLEALDNFGRPPPPRHLSAVQRTRTQPRSLSEAPFDGLAFQSRVRQFQHSQAHPYASRSRVQTAQVGQKRIRIRIRRSRQWTCARR